MMQFSEYRTLFLRNLLVIILLLFVVISTACQTTPTPTTTSATDTTTSSLGTLPTTSTDTTVPTTSISDSTETTILLEIHSVEGSIIVGSYYQLSVTGGRMDDLLWSSSDDQIALVTSKGILSAVAPGSAEITVKERSSGRTASIHITVIEQEIIVDKDTIEYEYDLLGRVVKVIYPDGSSITYAYDANGNITSIEKQ